MPIVALLLLLAPVPLSMVAMDADLKRENKINEMCVEKFKTNEEIQQCKTILMRVNNDR